MFEEETAFPDFYHDSVWRDLEGAIPNVDDPSKPSPRLPRKGPIHTRLEGPTAVAWIDGLENPYASTGLLPSSNPQIDHPDIGYRMGPGDYRGEYRTIGPVHAWGHEVSGGLWGEQAYGRIMRFPSNIPDRYDANGVWVGDYRDSLAGQLHANRVPLFTDIYDMDSLLYWSGPDSSFSGWEG